MDYRRVTFNEIHDFQSSGSGFRIFVHSNNHQQASKVIISVVRELYVCKLSVDSYL